MFIVEPFDLRPPLRVAALTGSVGTLNQTSRPAQRQLLNDFIPSRINTDEKIRNDHDSL